MEIKTIRKQLDYVEDFDKEVNAAMADGWKLTKREVLVPPTDDKHIMVYAELEKPDEKTAEELLEAAKEGVLVAMGVLHDICKAHYDCSECPVGNICNGEMPCAWALPEDKKGA